MTSGAGNEAGIKIILAGPRNPDNIGAAARAMANFGLYELAVVSPHLPSWREGARASAAHESGASSVLEEAARAALGAEHIITAAKICSSVAEAAADCALLLGTSALQRRTPDRDVLKLDELPGRLAEWLPRGKKAGLLFGSERSGLSNEELSYCRAVINIPTREKQPSMNLGQAVAVVCYELRGRASAAPPRALRPAVSPSIREIERVISEIYLILREERGPGRGAAQHEAELRRALLDARMTKGAMGVLRILLRRARALTGPGQSEYKR